MASRTCTRDCFSTLGRDLRRSGGPGKQKTRRPERRGITQALSPKKIGEERNECRKSRTAVEEARRSIRCGSKRGNRHRARSLLTSAASANVIGSIKEEQNRKITTSTISRGNMPPLESFLAGGSETCWWLADSPLVRRSTAHLFRHKGRSVQKISGPKTTR